MDELLRFWQPMVGLVVFTAAFATLKADTKATRRTVDDGFKGVHERLDKLNGQVYDHEGRISGVEARLED